MNTSNSFQAKDLSSNINFAEIFNQLKHCFTLILGLAALGFSSGILVYVIAGYFSYESTSTRVVFSFPGFEKGEYPDKSKFQADDLRSPEVISEALKRKGIADIETIQSKVRAGVSIQAIIPDNIVKERDKLRASGQTPRLYVPDEYSITLTIPRSLALLTTAQREAFLREMVTVYQEKFIRTYVYLPLNFGNAFETLGDSDYLDYEIIFSQETNNLLDFISKLADIPTATNTEIKLNPSNSRTFRSSRTNLSFSDLLKEAQFFSQIRLNETLGLIRENGLSMNRQLALLKIDYYLKTLSEEESRALEEEKVVQALLKQSQERMQNYVLGIKSQTGTQRSDATVIDQGLVDSLLANDANNFLVRESLKASLKTRRIQSEKAILLDRRKNITDFITSGIAQKTEVLEQFQKSLEKTQSNYNILINNIRLTYQDYQQQYYGNAVQVSMEPVTKNPYLGLGLAGITGTIIGIITGASFALLGLGIKKNRN